MRIVSMRTAASGTGPVRSVPMTSVEVRARGRSVHVHDSSWTLRSKPPWYLLNHGTMDANATLCAEGGAILWRAKRDISSGEEILFNYNPGIAVAF